MQQSSRQIDFGRTVRSFRKAAGLSQEMLARKSGVHRTYVGSIERGEANVTLATMVRLALALEVSVADLVSSISVSDSES